MNYSFLENIDACIFDMDGTLVDSMWMWKQIDIDFFSKYNIEFPDDLQKQIEGMSFIQTAKYMKEAFNFPITVEEMMAEWNSMAMNIYRTKINFKPGAYDFLCYLKKHGIKLGIATSNSRELFDAVRLNLGLDSIFDCMLTGSEITNGKPAPDVYLKVAQNLNVPCEKCLVFEDIIPGILAGKNANMKVVAVEDEYSRTSKQEKIELADYYLNSYLNIKDIYEKV